MEQHTDCKQYIPTTQCKLDGHRLAQQPYVCVCVRLFVCVYRCVCNITVTFVICITLRILTIITIILSVNIIIFHMSFSIIRILSLWLIMIYITITIIIILIIMNVSKSIIMSNTLGSGCLIFVVFRWEKTRGRHTGPITVCPLTPNVAWSQADETVKYCPN